MKFAHADFWPLNTTLWVKEFKKGSPAFAYHLLSGMKLEHYRGGAAVPTLNRNVVHEVDVVVPPNALLDDFDTFANKGLKQVRLLQQQNAKLKEARDLLLPRLMSGEIAV